MAENNNSVWMPAAEYGFSGSFIDLKSRGFCATSHSLCCCRSQRSCKVRMRWTAIVTPSAVRSSNSSSSGSSSRLNKVCTRRSSVSTTPKSSSARLWRPRRRRGKGAGMVDGCAVFLGLDVGKGQHHAVGLAPDGRRLHDAPLPNTKTRLGQLFDRLARHGRTSACRAAEHTKGMAAMRGGRPGLWM